MRLVENNTSQMRWLFVGEALVLRKEQRILVFIVLKPTLSSHTLRRSAVNLSRTE